MRHDGLMVCALASRLNTPRTHFTLAVALFDQALKQIPGNLILGNPTDPTCTGQCLIILQSATEIGDNVFPLDK